MRARVLTPDVSSTRLAVRGFHHKNDAARERLETIGATFLGGFRCAAGSAGPDLAGPELETVPQPLRGFAYEGAAMAFALLDALSARRSRIVGLLAGYGRRHPYMTYVGTGWAMARLPSVWWPRLPAPDPLLRWLMLDGYGFHQAYFRTREYVREQRRPVPRWPGGGTPRDVASVVDQGVGRALWFVAGTDVTRAADLVDAFAPERHADLYSGVGLAATYAGGADRAELATLRQRAGRYRPQLAQGSAFAAKARTLAGLTTDETGQATEALCGLTPEQAAKVTEETCPDPGTEPAAFAAPAGAYRLWRERIAACFADVG